MEEFLKSLDAATKKVDKELNRSLLYSENNYQNALIHYLNGLLTNTAVSREVHISYQLSDGFVFGSGRADIVCETEKNVFILELKVNSDYKWIKKHSGQTLRYVRHYPGQKKIVGILILFNCNCSAIIKVLP